MSTHHPYWLVLASLTLALIPIVVTLCTSFVKVQVVLSFVRSGLGAQQIPSGMVIFGLSIAMSFIVMSPTLEQFQKQSQAFPWDKAEKAPLKLRKEEVGVLLEPWYLFLKKHSGKHELEVFTQNTSGEVKASERIPWSVLMPAFLVTELKEAFIIGFVVLIPFLVIDLIVANILAGIGMFMVSPVMISLPLKVALFTFADGWLLLTTGLTRSYLG